MLKRLRWKFVLINMSLVCVVLAVVLGAQVAGNLRQIRAVCDSALEMALLWGEDGPGRWEIGGGQFPMGRPESDNGPFDREFGAMIPTVCVTLDADGTLVNVADNNVDISEENLTAAVEAALETGKDQGAVSDPDLRFRLKRENGVTRIAFADRTWERSSLRSDVLTALIIFAAALLGFLVVSFFLSKWALRPVERSWQQQRQFMADASHELKTPLTVMLADTNILLSHPEQTIQSQRKWVEYIQDEAQRMKQLVEDMLFLTRSDSGVQRDEVRGRVELSDLLQSCLLSFEPVAFESGVELDGLVEPGIAVTGDEEQLRRLIAILLDNACKYAGPAGVVTLRLGRSGERVTLTVHNTGEAISAEDQQHLFERFYRTDAARDRQKGGYGLGLSIAQSIAQSHGGKIAVASAPGEGVTFTVTLSERQDGA